MPDRVSATILRGNALALPLADESVDLIVTSPPYWRLRSYQDGGAHCPGQIGAERTPGEYVDNLIATTREMVRVLKSTGSIFVVLGDKYGRNKSLLGLPSRYAIRCQDELNLLLRAEIIWSKTSGFIDAKAAGRFRRTHEVIYHFTTGPDYYEDVETLRRAPVADYQQRPQYRRAMELFTAAGFTDAHAAAVRSVGVIDSDGGQVRSGGSWQSEAGRLAAEVRTVLKSYYRELCGNGTAPKGNLPGSVWDIPVYPFKPPAHLKVKHFAGYPTDLPRQIIQAFSPVGGVVLDPFGGSGTTKVVADALGRHGVVTDMSMDYCRLAQWRTSDPGQIAKTRQEPKPVPEPPGMQSLFSDGAFDTPLREEPDQPVDPLTANPDHAWPCADYCCTRGCPGIGNTLHGPPWPCDATRCTCGNTVIRAVAHDRQRLARILTDLTAWLTTERDRLHTEHRRGATREPGPMIEARTLRIVLDRLRDQGLDVETPHVREGLATP